MNRPSAPCRILFASIALAACNLAANLSAFAQTDPNALLRSTPEEQGVDSERLARMLIKIRDEGLAIDSFLLVRNDHLVAEAYGEPYNSSTRHPMYSVTKSFTSAALGIALDQGLVGSVNDRVIDLLPGTASAPSPNLQRMTLRHLLTMATGHGTDSTNTIAVTGDWVRAFMDFPVPNEPGSQFLYDSGGSCMISAIVQRATGMTTKDFADRQYLRPMGITNYTWDYGPNNLTIGGWGLALTPYDMAKFGQLFLHRGNWNGQQLVPAAWVDECSRKQMSNGNGGSLNNSGYGYQFWMNDFGGYRADGAFGQLIFILPEYHAVAVFTAGLPNSGPEGDLMRQYVLPAMAASGPLALNPRGNALLSYMGGIIQNPPRLGSRPYFTTLPESQTVPAGGSVTLTAAAEGASLSYQWFKDGVLLLGETGPALTISHAASAHDGGYFVTATNPGGQATSQVAVITVQSAPQILTAPVSLHAAPGREAVFTASATGGNLTWEWQHDGRTIADATGPMLRLPAVAPADAGRYTLVVRNPRGTASAEPVTLTVAPMEDSPRLINLSARTLAGGGDQTLVVGLSIQGSDTGIGLPVLLRGVGPSLGPLGVGSPMLDPAVRLFNGQQSLAANSDWQGDAFLADLSSRLGAFALPGASNDAALFRVLPNGLYTFHVTSSRAENNVVALAECYDATGGLAQGSPRLVNLSARASVVGGDGTLIAGFVIQGSGSLRVLIRGIGPALSPFGVSGILTDPVLRLYAGQTLIAENDNWGGGAELRSTFSSVGAFALPDNSADAALLVSLPSGIYTAHVTGKNGAAGVALVELYAVP